MKLKVSLGNKKTSSTARNTRSEEARASDIDDVLGAKSQKVSETGKDLTLELDVHTSHESGFGHGVAEVDLVALGEQVFAPKPEAYYRMHLIVDGGIEEREVLFLFSVANSSVKTADLLDAGDDIPESATVVGTEIPLVGWGCNHGILHVQVAMVGADLPVAVDAPVGFHF